MTTYRPYIAPLIGELIQRSQRASLGLLGLAQPSVRAVLARQLTAAPGTSGSQLADPVFEPTFGWTESTESVDQLTGGLLHPRLVRCLANPPALLAKDYTFPTSRAPYSHQLEAWRYLAQPQPGSLVVTSGTGSGKTECFLIPILNRLARQVDQEGQLEGVRALFLYPLNALIASQKNRLDAWTDGFDGDIRYCLYTGELEQSVKGKPPYKGMVKDRQDLRASPPPVLVTNATMLEYMLIRKEDEPILAKSKGKLEWIVLDEAHTHIGSQAAEMALLLRRVMLGFDVDPKNVRFVATSATFGDDADTVSKLKQFIAEMAGVSTAQVHVVHGKRKVPLLPSPAAQAVPQRLADIEAVDSGVEVSPGRFGLLSTHPAARTLRQAFIEGGQTKARRLSQLLAAPGAGDRASVLRWLDLMSGTREVLGGEAFLPFRVHLFHQVISGLYACVDPACPCKAEELKADDWSFGCLYTSERKQCDCGAPVLSLVACTDCASLHLEGTISGAHKLVPRRNSRIDEFELDAAEAEDEAEEAGRLRQDYADILVTNRPYEGRTDQVTLSRATHELPAPVEDEQPIRLSIAEPDGQWCPACEAATNGRPLMRRLSVGGPMTMGLAIGTLLEFCADDEDSPLSKPARGRKMISFTDSRQGTARLALKLQQDSERSRVRGLIYHYLLQRRHALAGEAQPDTRELRLLERIETMGELSHDETERLQQLRAAQAAPVSVELSWDEMRTRLAGSHDIETGLLDHYRALAYEVFSGGNGSPRLAQLFLYREFARRPKNRNSLESMGLVALSYPKLQSIDRIPLGWPFTLGAWRDYLKVLLDFFVRENSFVDIDKELQRLIGIRINPKWLLPPTEQVVPDKRHIRWPQVNEGRAIQSRPIKLLLKTTGWTLPSKTDTVNALLQAAWRDLVDKGVLTKSESAFRLDFSTVNLRLVTQAGVCPVTRRFLDTVFEGVSPYDEQGQPARLAQVVIPVYTHAFGPVSEHEANLAHARNWLETEPAVRELRETSLWTDLHDRTVEGGTWMRCAEHSAQQGRTKLKDYEDKFKTGRVNLMSCSTTMEMGVDIGGISVVAMNNVPPHPANYLQRAGRAGRRREGRSVALTVCKNTPHDQGVFARPDWPFSVAIPIPRVSLQSPDLIQRHINAWSLSYWLQTFAKSEELTGITAGAFFLKQGELSAADRFARWCAHADANLSADLCLKVRRLTAHTALSSVPPQRLIKASGTQMLLVARDWLRMQQGVVQQLEVFKGDASRNLALKALEIQIRRVEGEYLLSELANRRFLPGYGFPTDVVSLDNRCRSTMLDETRTREDNRGRHNALPSRERVTALREYAPGADIVMDGLVYKSSGVTLNWHVPTSETDIKEAQLFKHAWRCSRCGASGNTVGARPECCESCGHSLEAADMMLYLVPSGFAVDFFDEPHTDVSSQQYLPVQAPWVSVNAPWLALANPAAGQFRSSTHAHFFNHSSGLHGNGYSICLECGRAEASLAHPDPAATENEQFVPAMFRAAASHRRLRGNKGGDGTRMCEGSNSSWKIKHNVHLGHDSRGDCIELLLAKPDGIGWLDDEVAAFSIAVAVRTAIAASFGILEEELGCASAPVLIGDQRVRTVQVFDESSGGYSALAAPLLQTSGFWEKVVEALQCTAECHAACQHCLLTFDTRFAVEKLDRWRALEVINPKWIEQLVVPAELQLFGPATVAESLPFVEALGQQLDANDVTRVRAFLHGEGGQLDLPTMQTLHRLVYRCIATDLPISICLTEAAVAGLDEGSRYKLAEWVGAGAVCGLLPADAMRLNGHPLVAAAEANGQWVGWAVPGGGTANGELIGASAAGVSLLKGPLQLSEPVSTLSAGEIRPAGRGDRDLELYGELDGSIDGFGKRFWELVRRDVPGVATLLAQPDDALVEIIYSDRYLRSPLAVALFVSVAYQLKHFPAGELGCKVSVASIAYDGHLNQGRLWDDWADSAGRDAVLRQTLEHCGFDVAVKSSGRIEHARTLTLRFDSGRVVRVRLDQGFSYWLAAEHSRKWFDFARSVDEQATALAECPGAVAAPRDFPSHVFVSMVAA